MAGKENRKWALSATSQFYGVTVVALPPHGVQRAKRPTLSAHSPPSVGRTSPITSSTRRRRRTSTKEMEMDRRVEEWSDTPSHEGNSQLHPSSGNEWTPVGDSLNGLICNWFGALITGLVTPVSWLILRRRDEAGRLRLCWDRSGEAAIIQLCRTYRRRGKS